MTTTPRVPGRLRRARRAALVIALLAVGGSLAVSAQSASPLVRHSSRASAASRSPSGRLEGLRLPPGRIERRQSSASQPRTPTCSSCSRRSATRDPACGSSPPTPLRAEASPTTSTSSSRRSPGHHSRPVRERATSQLTASRNVIKPVRRQTVQLPAGTSVRLRYGLHFVLDGRQVEVATTQYVLIRGTVLHRHLHHAAVEVARLSALFEASARTIRLG